MTTITGDAEEEVLSSEDSEEEVLDPAVEAVSAVEASEAVPVAVEVPAHVSKKSIHKICESGIKVFAPSDLHESLISNTKRNNMKKYLSLVMIGLSLMLSGCNKDDNNDPDTPPTGDTGKVRYEATVSDPENFKLLIHYTVGVDISSEAPEEAAKETIVESPFTFEQEAKQGTYLWLSAYPIPKDEENLENLQLPKTVEVKIFIDDKLHKSNSGENYAMVQHIFGQENYQ